MAYTFQQYPAPSGPPPPYNQGPPVGFQGSPQPAYVAPTVVHSGTIVTTQPIAGAQPMVIVAGGNCPACRSGLLVNEFTCCGICLGICFFPLGILCCWLMRERKCTSCRASFGSA